VRFILNLLGLALPLMGYLAWTLAVSAVDAAFHAGADRSGAEAQVMAVLGLREGSEPGGQSNRVQVDLARLVGHGLPRPGPTR
jgi:hypothetical protein